MKIFDWIHGKIHGKQSVSKPNPNTAAYASHACEKEEFSDWPNGLLAIGTFGNNTAKDSAEKSKETPYSSSCEDQQQDQELTVEEVGELSKELKLLVHKHSVNGSEKDKVALQKLFDCLQNMEEDEETAITELMISESSGKEESTKRGKEVQMEDKSSSHFSKKSLSFLLKKAILCRGGFAPPPPLPPPLPLRERFPAETKFEKSRMEKILRAILHKKIYPQASNPRAATKKYLDNNLYLCENTDDDDSEDEAVVGKQASEGSSKWVKTDSDFIVLEI
ncbi:PREDICTED: protein LAZY 1-like [Ipomoea nil]|uniref:protein LAZY 1-like n=1 Tax=Ipomoea nil TaxID=35883 RepID=UPI0009008E9A|nr:PREDICTED: protein LAZY 1-like [Ipomoea nil]